MRAPPRVTASQVFRIVRAPRERGLMIEAALERSDSLRVDCLRVPCEVFCPARRRFRVP